MTDSKGNKRKTLLSAMENIVSKAKALSLTERFYEEAKESLAYITKILQQ